MACEPEQTHEASPRREFLLKGAALTGMSVAALGGMASAQATGASEGRAAVEAARRERGLAALQRLTGSTGEAVIDSLADMAPELGDWIIDFAYGDVFSRPQLDLRSRQFATIAALTAMGTAAPQLRVHIQGALNVGCTKQEIIEVILQMAVYAGFPAAINAINVAREVFEERAEQP